MPVTLVNGHRRERSQIRGYATVPELYRIIDVDQRETLPAGDGLVLTDRLAAKLGVRVGDTRAGRGAGRPRRARWSWRWTPRCAR